MNLDQIFWVVLPHGRDAVTGHLKASIVVTPKPVGDGVTTDVTSFEELRDWPSTLRRTSLALVFSNSAGVASAKVSLTTQSADSALWKGVFPEKLLVKAPPAGDAPLGSSYDAISGYTAVDTYVDSLVTYEANRANGVDAMLPPLPDTAALQAYMNSLASGGGEIVSDFHSTVHGVMQVYPVARRLGLLFDVDLTFGSLAGYDRVQLVAMLDGTTVFRSSASVAVASGFLIASDDYVVNGLLSLAHASHEVRLDQIDPLAEIANLSKSVQTLPDGSSDSTNTLVATPIVLLYGNMSQRALALRTKVPRMLTLLRAGHVVGDPLTAHEVAIGYAVDVREFGTERKPIANPPWRSLCDIDVLMRFADGTTAEVAYEGHIAPLRASVLKSGGVAASDVLVRWSNENLCAASAMGMKKEFPKLKEGQKFAVITHARSEALPKLRYGHRYRFRLRAMDASGWTHAPDAEDDATTSDLITYRRFDPIHPPILADGVGHERSAPHGNGDGTYHVVIRTFNDGDDPIAYRSERNVRYILPPKMSMSALEAHGVLDTDGNPDGTKLARASELDGIAAPTSMHQRGHVGYLVDPLCRHVGISILPDVGRCDPPAGDLRMTDFGADHGSTYWNGHHVNIRPWKLLLQSLSTRKSGIPREVDVGADAITAKLDIDRAQRTVTLSLQPGISAQVTLTSLFDYDSGNPQKFDSPLLNLPNRVTGALTAAQAGRLPSVTPSRAFAVVHATKRPWFAPVVASATCARSIAAKIGAVTIAASLPNRSAGSYRLDAASPEWGYDTNHQPMRAVRKTSAGVWDLAIPTARVTGWIPPNPAPPFWAGLEDTDKKSTAVTWLHDSDTAYHNYTYTLTARSRFHDYFPNARSEHLERTSLPFAPMPVFSNTSRPDPLKAAALIPTLRWMHHAPGIGRTRLGWSLRLLLDPEWYRSGDDETVGIVVPDVTTPPTFVPKYVSWIGADPVAPRSPTSSLAAYKFENGDRVVSPVTSVILAQVDDVSGLLIEGSVQVLPLRVRFDAARKRWYADLRLSAPAPADASKYMPFLQLVVGRFQLHSLGGQQLSQVKTLDAIQLLPTRSLHLKRTAYTRVTATLNWPDAGVSPTRDNQIEVRLDPRDPHSDALSKTPIPIDMVAFDATGNAEYNISNDHLDEYTLSVSEYEVYLADRANGIYRRRLVYYDAFELRHV